MEERKPWRFVSEHKIGQVAGLYRAGEGAKNFTLYLYCEVRHHVESYQRVE